MKTKAKNSYQRKQTLCMRVRIKSLTLLVLLCGAAIAADAADIVSFNIAAGIPGTDPNWLNAQTGFAGAPGVRTNWWNNCSTNVSFNMGYTTDLLDIVLPPGTITNELGNVVPSMGVHIYLGTGCANPDRNSSAGSQGGSDDQMVSDVLDPNQGTNNNGNYTYGYIDFSNIPYANYNIYCYTLSTEGGNGTSGTRGGFWLITNTPAGFQRIYCMSQSNGTWIQLPVPTLTTYSNAYIRATTTSIPATGATWADINGGNYGEFTGLTNSHTRIWFGPLGDGGADDLGELVTGGSTAQRFKQAGYQIQQVILATPTNIVFLSPVYTNLLLGNPSAVPVQVESQNVDGSSNDITGQLGMTYTSADTNIFTISAIGSISPGLQGGTTNLVAAYAGTWGTLYATQSVTVLPPISLTPTVVKSVLYIGKNGVFDFTDAHLFAGYNDPVLTNVEVTGFNGAIIGNATPATISFASPVITAIAAGNFGISGSYGGLNVTVNPVGVVQNFQPVGNPGISVKLTDVTPPATAGMLFTALSGVPGGNGDVTGLGARLPYWNNLIIPPSGNQETGELTGPLDSGGNVLTNVTIYYSAATSDGGTIISGVRISTNESQLWGSYWDVGVNNDAADSPNPGSITASNTGSITISNIPYTRYDVYCYIYNDASVGSDSGSSRVGEFDVDGVTNYRINDPSAPYGPTNNGIGYTEATDFCPPNPPPSSINDLNLTPGNFVHFSDVTNSTLVVNFAAMASDLVSLAAQDPRLRLEGFQIVESLDLLTATNIYLSPTNVPVLPANGSPYDLTVLANFSDGTIGGNVTTEPGIGFSSANTSVFTVDAGGVITPGSTAGTATLTVSYTNATDNSVVTLTAPVTVQTVPQGPVPITFVHSAGNIQFSWPPSYLGWRLETNSVGLTATNDWFTYPGSTAVTNITVPIGSTGDVYFRLVYP